MSLVQETKVVQETKIHLGMGAIIHDQGVAFRVWAPHAEEVSVVGSFNDWDPQANPCEREENDNWYVDIPNAKPGDEYRFWLRSGDQSISRIDPRARQVTNSVGNGVIYGNHFDWQGDAFKMHPWNESVIYEMHVGTFNVKGDGVGRFETAKDRLPYLKSLGVNVVELMPLAEFAGDYSWGYNPAHPYAIETAYGGPEALKLFIREAHKLGIAVIIDVVYNHFGPSDLDLWQFDGWSHDNKGGIYFYNDSRSTTPWGDTRPDYGRGEVRTYIFDNAMMWLDEYHADGLRYDMTLYMRSIDGDESNSIPEGFSLAQWINREISERYPGKMLVAEDLRNNAYLTKKHGDGGAHFSTQWDANFVHPVRDVITQIEDQHRSMDKIRGAILHKYNLDAYERVIYTESHDEVANGKQRVVSEIDPSEKPNRYAVKRSTLGAALIFTAPGVPMLFQGQEFLTDKWFDDGNPLDWSRKKEYEGIVQMYRDLIAIRLNKNGLTSGFTGQNIEVFHCHDEQKVVAFRRWENDNYDGDVLVVLNFSEGVKEDYTIGIPTDQGQWKLLFNGDCGVYHPELDKTEVGDLELIPEEADGYSHSAKVSIGPYSCLIFARVPQNRVPQNKEPNQDAPAEEATQPADAK